MRSLIAASLAMALALSGCIYGPGWWGHMTDEDGEFRHHHERWDEAWESEEHSESPLPFTGDEDVVVHVETGPDGEYSFTPDALRLPTNATVGLVYHNNGTRDHELTVPGFDVHLHADPGETASGAFRTAGPTNEAMACFLPGHFQNGMRGVVVVEEMSSG